MLKLLFRSFWLYKDCQPPSGGCVLKPLGAVVAVVEAEPAAFGRLCVETSVMGYKLLTGLASRLRAAVC